MQKKSNYSSKLLRNLTVSRKSRSSAVQNVSPGVRTDLNPDRDAAARRGPWRGHLTEQSEAAIPDLFWG
jgi:hypothetical protein